MRAQQARHVLDGQHVGAGVDDLLGQAEVVVQGVEPLGRVEQVGGVAEGDLGHGGPGGTDGVDGRAHLGDVVEGVEDAEHVDPGAGGLLDEGLGDARRVGRVADGVAPAQQHLQAEVGHRLAQRGQPVPGVLAEEAQRDVVGGPAPALDAQQLRHGPGHVRGHGQQVGGAHAGGQQRLVGVPERGVGDAGDGAGAQVRGEALGAQLEQALPGAGRRGHGQVGRGQLDRRRQLDGDLAVGPVDGDVGEVREQPGAAVRAGAGRDQVRALVDERRGEPARTEVGVGDHRLEERDVGRHPPDPELRERPAGPRHGGREVAPPADELGEHGVEVRGDLRPGVGGAAVQADAGAAGVAVRGDAAHVGAEAVGRVLGGDAELDGGAVHPEGVLGQAEVRQGGAGGDEQLRGHEVDVGDLLGDGVLDLDARVHLDEHVLPGPLALGGDEELHRAGVAVADGPGEGDGVAVQRLPGLLVQVRGGGDLDDLLVPALDGAVALEEVDDLAVGVREDLDLDVAGAEDRPLDEHPGVAEGALRLAHRCGERLGQVVADVDAAHPAPAAAGDGLDEDREADLVRGREQGVGVVGGLGRLQHGQAGPLRGGDGGDLVAGHLQHVRGRPDERDPGLLAGGGQVGVLGQEAVARVDRVRAALLGDPDDLRDVEVGPHGRTPLADEVRLVRLDPVDAVAVLPGEHRDRAGAQLGGGPEGADGDLASVGDQDLLEQRDPRGLVARPATAWTHRRLSGGLAPAPRASQQQVGPLRLSPGGRRGGRGSRRWRRAPSGWG